MVNFVKSAQNLKIPESFAKLSCFPTKCQNESRENLECVEEVHESSNPADSPWSLWKQSTVASGGREESRKKPHTVPPDLFFEKETADFKTFGERGSTGSVDGAFGNLLVQS